MKSILLSLLCCMALNAVAQQPIDYYNSQAYRAHERGDKAEAAKCFLLYLQEPQRRGMTQAQQDSLYQADRRVYDQAAVNAIYLFYSVNDMDGVMKALPYGRRTSKGISNVYIAGMEACKEKGMNDLWMELLKEAIVRCPQNPQFSDRLIEYYQSKKGNMAEAYAEMDKLIAANPQNADAWYAKGVLYFNVDENNTEARNCFSKAIALDEDNGYACAGMGSTYLQDVILLRRQGQFSLVFSGSDQKVKQSSYNKELAEVQTYYFNARTYFEMAKRRLPDKYDVWGNQLLECYKMLKQKDKYDQLYKEINEE